jgi:hypothetical protein
VTRVTVNDRQEPPEPAPYGTGMARRPVRDHSGEGSTATARTRVVREEGMSAESAESLVDLEDVPVENARMGRPAADVAGAFRQHGAR